MLTRCVLSPLVLTLFLLSAHSCHSQIFSDQANAFGIDTYNQGIFGSGVSVYDWNEDGWDDISIVMPGEGVRFYQNNLGSFDLIDFGLQGLAEVKQMCWLDFDNDGDKDLFCNQLQASIKLFENQGDFVMVDISEQANLSTNANDGYGACWGDIDNDGFLDLYVSNYFFNEEGQQNLFYYNMGNGTFIEIGEFMGIDNGLTPTLQSVFFDYDSDGDQDLFVANDRYNYTNYMYQNNGDEFLDLSQSLNVNDAIWSMCATVDDYDNDADLDLYITNNQNGNILHQNQDGEIFFDVASETNTLVYASCWGSIFFDINNDGWKDLYVASAPVGDEIPGYHHLYINNQGTFVAPGITGFGLDNEPTYSAAKGDFNNDGYVDFITHSSDPLGTQIWVNNGGSLNHLKVGLEGVVSNRDGIGATIRAWLGDEVRTEYVMCGEGYLSQHSQYEHFGLENNEFVDSLKVYWTSGHVDSFYNVEANQTFHIAEGSGINASLNSSEGLSVCYGETSTLSTGTFTNYLWSTGEQTAEIEVTESGTYWVTVTTPEGLEATSDAMYIEFLPESQLEVESMDVSCSGGDDGWLNLYIVEGSGLYEVFWGDETFGTYLEGLPSGSYFYEAVDSLGCVSTGEVFVNEPQPLTIEITTEGVSCFGDLNGQANAEITGGTPGYMIDWKGADPNALPGGTYFVVVTDTLGCEEALEYTIAEPELIEIFLTIDYIDGLGMATVSPEGGTPPYDIIWDNGGSEISIEELSSGTYEVSVTDSLGCSSSEVFTITNVLENSEAQITVMPNPFKDRILLNFPSPFSGQIQLFDLNGRLVLTEVIISQEVHQISTAHFPSGTYTLVIDHERHKMIKD